MCRCALCVHYSGMNQKYALTAKKANSLLDCTRKSNASPSRVVILPSTQHWWGCIQVWAPQYETCTYWREYSKEPWRWLRDWNICHRRRGRESWDCSLEKRKLRRTLPVCMNTWWGSKEDSGAPWQDKSEWEQTEIQEIPFRHKKKLFYCEGGQTQNRLLGEAVESLSLEILKTNCMQLSLAGPALNRGLVDLQMCLPTSAVRDETLDPATLSLLQMQY